MTKKKIRLINRTQLTNILKAIAIFALAMGFVVGATLLSNWVNKKVDSAPEQKIEATGEKEYGCTYDWKEDKVIKDCKWYPVYRKVE